MFVVRRTIRVSAFSVTIILQPVWGGLCVIMYSRHTTTHTKVLSGGYGFTQKIHIAHKRRIKPAAALYVLNGGLPLNFLEHNKGLKDLISAVFKADKACRGKANIHVQDMMPCARTV